MKTLQQIIAEEQAHRTENGMFGMKACKESVMDTMKYSGKSLFTQLEEYTDRANNDPMFNKRMVLAVWELINEI